MRRSAVLFAMLLAMLWQSMALARPGSTINVLIDQAHAALHWQAEGHHHHDDGSLHLDDSQASKLHGVCDHLTATAALLPASPQPFLPSASERPGGLRDVPLPDPFVDGPLRPPRARA